MRTLRRNPITLAMFTFNPKGKTASPRQALVLLLLICAMISLFAEEHKAHITIGSPPRETRPGNTSATCPAPPGPIVIDFETLPTNGEATRDGLPVFTQYECLGVVFPLKATIKESAAIARSGSRSLQTFKSPDQEFDQGPLVIRFTAPQRRVKVWAGQISINTVPLVAVLRVYDAASGGNLLSEVKADLPATPVGNPSRAEIPLEVSLPDTFIQRAEVIYLQKTDETDGAVFEVIDDLEFDGQPAPPPVPDLEAPQVVITLPSVAQITGRTRAISLAGFVREETALQQITVTIEGRENGVTEIIDRFSFSGNAPRFDFGPTLINAQVDPRTLTTLNTITVQARDFAGNLGEASVIVVFGLAAEVTSTIDLFPLAMEVTQATAPLVTIPPPPAPGAGFGNVRGMADFPLVADKKTIVRVYGGMLSTLSPSSSSDAFVSGVTAELTGIGPDGQVLPRSPLVPNPGTITIRRDPELSTRAARDRGNINASWNFELPIEWTQAGTIRLRATVNPTQQIDECPNCFTTRNDMLLTNVTFVETATFDVFPVWFNFNSVEASASAHTSLFEGEFKTMYPLARIEYHLLPGNHLSVSRDLTTEDGWFKLITDDLWDYYTCNKAALENLGRGHTGVFYGLVPKRGVRIDLFAGLGVSNGYPLAIGIEDLVNAATQEVGHTRRFNWHAPSDRDGAGNVINSACGSPDNELLSYPFFRDFRGDLLARASIGEFGLDTDNLRVKAPAYINDGAYYDFMSYCGVSWISPFTRGLLLDQFHAAAASFVVLPILSGPQDYLFISGEILSQDSATFAPVYRLQIPAGTDDGAGQGNYSVELQGPSGQVLFKRNFDPGEIIEVPKASSFRQLIPLMPGTSRLVLKQGATVLSQLTASANTPNVKLLTPNGGESWIGIGTRFISWQASDADGDTLHYALQYSSDAGNNWTTLALNLTDPNYLLDPYLLSGSDSALIRVLASDGFNTGQDESDQLFQVGDKPPIAAVSTPSNNLEFETGSVIVFQGTATDREDGPLSGKSLSWSSTKDGALGIGNKVSVRNLSIGAHRIVLTAKDRSGNAGQAEVCIHVFAPGTAPPRRP